MQAYKYFNKLYTINHISKHYEEKIKNNASTGLDKISPKKFDSDLDENVKIIKNKVLSGSYKFTNYKQILIPKGEGKVPRSISIPTIRDKLTISILNELLVSVYGNDSISKMPHSIINDIKKIISLKDSSGNYVYDSFIKLDIQSYYSSINHEVLYKKLNKKIKKNEIINLIFSAIKTPSISIPIKSRKPVEKKIVGVPEGLSISNALANIYLNDIDNKYQNYIALKYFRYVDDILILCNSNNMDAIYNNIKIDLEYIHLKLNDKVTKGTLQDGFDYLGYRLKRNLISVRESSILKIEQSIENLFIDYIRSKNKNINLLEWKLNLKISGFILNGNKYGWLFFFSQMDDYTALYKLDWLINRLCLRYKLCDNLSLKKFKRTIYEITYKLHTTRYIPNFDTYDMKRKRLILSSIYNQDISNLSDNQILIEFKKIMAKEIKDIERDIQTIS